MLCPTLLLSPDIISDVPDETAELSDSCMPIELSPVLSFVIDVTPLPLSPLIDDADDTSEGSIPDITRMPAIASPIPAALATHMPLDHIFSTKIMPANSPIQSRFIHPSATIGRKYAQQQPRQYVPCQSPVLPSAHKEAHRRFTISNTCVL
jgi:hypothetical protein